MRIVKSFGIACLLSASQPLLAADQLAQVEVTAQRTPVVLGQSTANVSVITRADIERLAPRSVPDLLAGRAGIDVVQSGGIGKQSSLFMRGTNSNHVLVLLDGMRIGSVTTGAAALEQLPVEQIERIEIVRGPRASLYGADAIGGVIQIVTRQGQGDRGLVPSMHIEAGSQHSVNSNFGLSGGNDKGWFNASVGQQYTRGFNACRIGAEEAGAGCFVNEPDRDGYRAYHAALSGGWRFANKAQIQVQILRNVGFNQFDGSAFSGNDARQVEQAAGVHFKMPVTHNWQTEWSLAQSRDLLRNWYRVEGRRAPVNFINSRRDQASWINHIHLPHQQRIHAGIDWNNEHVHSDTAYTHKNRENMAVFVTYQRDMGAHSLELGGRHDHNQQFGNHNTGSAAWRYHFANQMTLTASYATAFHAPTFNDLYYPSMPGLPPSANDHLQPEKARHAELDLGAQYDRWHWQAALYRQTIRHMIVLDDNFTPANIGKARIMGMEAELGGHFEDYTWLVNATWVKPQNRAAGVNHGKRLARRAERSLRVDLDRQLGDFSLGTTLRAFSSRYDDAANHIRLPGFMLADVRASWQFSQGWQLDASMHNVFDKRYETVYYYNQPGRTIMLGLRYNPPG